MRSHFIIACSFSAVQVNQLAYHLDHKLTGYAKRNVKFYVLFRLSCSRSPFQEACADILAKQYKSVLGLLNKEIELWEAQSKTATQTLTAPLSNNGAGEVEEVKESGERIEKGDFTESRECKETVQALHTVQTTPTHVEKSTHIREALLLRATFLTLAGCPNKAEDDLDRLLSMQNLSIRVSHLTSSRLSP